MEVTAVFEPAKEGGYTCFVEEIPAAISQGETLDEARANLLDALKLVLHCQRDLVEKNLSPQAVREIIELSDAFKTQ
jgi:predicted RNase H-like HicB family nuclease